MKPFFISLPHDPHTKRLYFCTLRSFLVFLMYIIIIRAYYFMPFHLLLPHIINLNTNISLINHDAFALSSTIKHRARQMIDSVNIQLNSDQSQLLNSTVKRVKLKAGDGSHHFFCSLPHHDIIAVRFFTLGFGSRPGPAWINPKKSRTINQIDSE